MTVRAYHLLDQHRVIHQSQLSTIEPAWEDPKAYMRLRGLSPTVVNYENWPDNWRRHRILAADGLSCADPPGDHPPSVAEDRRSFVEEWAFNATEDAVHQGLWDMTQRAFINASLGNETPNRFNLLQGLCASVLAVADDDALILHDGVWPHIETTLKVTPRWWFNNVNHTEWVNVFGHIKGFRRFYYVGENDDGDLLSTPTHLTSITSTQMASGRSSGMRVIERRRTRGS